MWPDAAPVTFFLALVASALPYSLKPMHQQREGHKHAGRWLATQMNEKDWLQDPLAWAEWYAGRTLYKTASYDGQPEFVWIVIEKGKGSPTLAYHSGTRRIGVSRISNRFTAGPRTLRPTDSSWKCTR